MTGNSTEINIEIDTEDKLNSVFRTMQVETGGMKTDRGYVEIGKYMNTLNIKIFADDFVALRALTNSMLRLLRLSLEITEI